MKTKIDGKLSSQIVSVKATRVMSASETLRESRVGKLPIPVNIEFSDYGIFPGMTISAWYKDPGLRPRRFRGVVEATYPKYAVVKTDAGYRTTIHITDIACKMVSIISSSDRSVSARAATV